MKRSLSLEPFSRDHNDGLILARKLQEDRPGALEEFRRAWEVELKDHFDEEERLLGPLCLEPERERLSQEHREIRDLAFSAQPDAPLLGRLLHDHIRWEERVLFTALEDRATADQLDLLERETRNLEERRWPNDPQREKLVKRRWSQ
jgi:hypothetical protein